MPLVTYTNIEAFTGHTYSTADRNVLDGLADSVEKLFNKLTGRVFYSDDTTNHIEYFTLAYPRHNFYLKSTPTVELVSVEVYNENSETYVAYSGNSYLVDGRKVVLSSELTNLVPNYVKITYKGAALPSDVEQMLVEWALLIFNNRHDAGQMKKSQSAADTKRDYLIVENLPANLQNVIDAYRIPNV